MIEAILIAVVIAAVIFALVRDRDEERPAHMEGGGSHLRDRGDR